MDDGDDDWSAPLEKTMPMCTIFSGGSLMHTQEFRQESGRSREEVAVTTVMIFFTIVMMVTRIGATMVATGRVTVR
ncbi:hypothetical protein L2E82_36735 [Cichorium intybus]|uniref:Uncharacterized protein n=1 Tax=Cichorium intybus TaxID=13427 RepID=A0ACB9AD27_CICIN|nr:hypothetical protein L2E82_36735 [Cichorium intybus]